MNRPSDVTEASSEGPLPPPVPMKFTLIRLAVAASSRRSSSLSTALPVALGALPALLVALAARRVRERGARGEK